MTDLNCKSIANYADFRTAANYAKETNLLPWTIGADTQKLFGLKKTEDEKITQLQKTMIWANNRVFEFPLDRNIRAERAGIRRVYNLKSKS